MSKYVLYGYQGCEYCDKAKDLLSKHEILVDYRDVKKSTFDLQVLKSNGHKTVPQIYTPQGVLIGGYTELRKFLES